MPPPDQLRAYEDALAGTGRAIVDAYTQMVSSNAKVLDAAAEVDYSRADRLRSIGRAEAFGIRTGSWIGLGGMIIVGVSVVASAFGAPVPIALLGIIPGILVAAGGWIGNVLDRRAERRETEESRPGSDP